jgi:hypothetical protein
VGIFEEPRTQGTPEVSGSSAVEEPLTTGVPFVRGSLVNLFTLRAIAGGLEPGLAKTMIGRP